MSYSTDIIENVPRTSSVLTILKMYPSIVYNFKGNDLILSGKKEEVIGVRKCLNRCIKI